MREKERKDFYEKFYQNHKEYCLRIENENIELKKLIQGLEKVRMVVIE